MLPARRWRLYNRIVLYGIQPIYFMLINAFLLPPTPTHTFDTFMLTLTDFVMSDNTALGLTRILQSTTQIDTTSLRMGVG